MEISKDRMPRRPNIKKWARDVADQFASNTGVRLVRSDGGQVRTDAGELFFLENQLESMIAETFDIEQAPLVSRRLLPVRNLVAQGADTWAYTQYEHIGQAKLVTDYATDLPVVNAIGRKFTGTCALFGDQFMLSVMELQAAAFANKPLESTLLASARMAIEQQIDSYAAIGNTSLGTTGLVNIPALTPVAVITGNWAGVPATPSQIFADVSKLWYSIAQATYSNHNPNTLVFPDTLRPYLNVRMTDTDVTIETFLRQNLVGLQTIEYWHALRTAGAGATTRIIAFESSPRTAWLDIPQEFTPLPPQWESLAYKVPCYAKVCGVIIPYPLAFGYMDAC